MRFRATAGLTLRLVACLALVTTGAAYFAAYEGTRSGSGRVLMLVVGVFLLPVLWVAGELLGIPLMDSLESRTWWRQASSLVRIALGVAMSLPIFAFMAGVVWLFRNWIGASP